MELRLIFASVFTAAVNTFCFDKTLLFIRFLSQSFRADFSLHPMPKPLSEKDRNMIAATTKNHQKTRLRKSPDGSNFTSFRLLR
jgi:hypothetical protein